MSACLEKRSFLFYSSLRLSDDRCGSQGSCLLTAVPPVDRHGFVGGIKMELRWRPSPPPASQSLSPRDQPGNSSTFVCLRSKMFQDVTST